MKIKNLVCAASVMLASLTAAKAANTLTVWSFDNLGIGVNASPAPSTGFGAATAVGFGASSAPDVQALPGSSAGSANSWRVRGVSPVGWATNAAIGAQGAQFAASTFGFYQIKASFDVYATTNAEAFLQVQYTTEGTIWQNANVTLAGSSAVLATNSIATNGLVVGTYVIMTNNGTAAWNNGVTVDLTGIPGVDNNPNFAIRIVNAATGTNCLTTTGAHYDNAAGDWTIDNVTFQGTTIDTIADWTFESYGKNGYVPNPVPEVNFSTTNFAQALGFTTSYHFSDGTVGSTNAPDTLAQAGSSTPNGTFCWRVRGQGPGNGWFSGAPIGAQGGEFDASTKNYTNVVVSFDLYFTTQGESKMCVLYTTNGWVTTNVVPNLAYGANPTYIHVNSPTDPDIAGAPDSTDYANSTVQGVYFHETYGQNWFNNLVVDFTGVPGVSDNPKFGIRIVNAATGNACVNFTGGSYNNSSGNTRFDNVTIGGQFIGTNAPALNADLTATVDRPFTNTFTVNATNTVWASSISSIYVNGSLLAGSAYTVSGAAGTIIFNPTNSALLQSSGGKTITVYATNNFTSTKVYQPLLAGAFKTLLITNQPAGPSASGGTLTANPNLVFVDKYGNGSTNPYASVSAIASVSGSGWTLGGGTNILGANGFITYTDLTATLTGTLPISNAQLQFAVYTNGVAYQTLTSSVFTVGAPTTRFVNGDLAVLQLDTTTANTTFSVIELRPSTANQTVPVSVTPISATGANALRLSSSGSAGRLTLSDDGTLICFAAFADGSAATPDETYVLNRAVGTLNYTNGFNLNATYTSISLGGSEARSCCTFDDNNFMIDDKAGLYFGSGVIAPPDNNPNVNALNNVVVRSFGGTYYVETQKTANGSPIPVVYTIDPNTGNVGPNNLGTDPVANDFYLISTNGGSTYDVMYILDGVSSSLGAINKYSWVAGANPNNPQGHYGWNYNGSFTNSTGGDSLFAATNGAGGVSLFYTTTASAGNSVVRVTDSAGWNQTISITSSNVIYTAPGLTAVKGLTFVPRQDTNTAQLIPPPVLIYQNDVTNGSSQFILTNTPSDALWLQSITAITVNGHVLSPADYATNQAGLLVLYPSNNPAYYLGSSGTSMGTNRVIISANGYSTNYGVQYYVAAPICATTNATSIKTTSAIINGYVTPQAGTAGYWFVYGTNSTLSAGVIKNTVTNTLAAGIVPVGVLTNALSGLLPGNKYYYQIAASTLAGTTYGGISNFTTTVASPTVVTLLASNILAISATLDGSVNPGGGATTNWFKFGTNTTTAFNNFTSPSNTLAAGNSVVIVTNLVGSLLPNTTYYFQAFAANSAGTSSGVTNSFTTAAAAPSVVTLTASNVSYTTATLDASVNPSNSLTAYWFNYGTTGSYGSSSPTNTLAAGVSAVTVTNLLTGLLPDTTYHYQVVATNLAGTVSGADVVFKTLPLTAVSFLGVAAGDASGTDVMLWTRAVDTNSPVSLPLQARVSTDSTFSSGVTTWSASTDTSRDYTAKLNVTGLTPNTRYYYNFVFTNSVVTNTSLTGTFKTPPAANAAAPVTFAFSGDYDGLMRPYTLGYNFTTNYFDFFMNVGDTIYETASTGSAAVNASGSFGAGLPTSGSGATMSQLYADYTRKYREQFIAVNPGGQNCLQDFFAAQGNYTLLDNHELGNKQYMHGGAAAGGSVGDAATGRGVDPAVTANDVNTSGTYMNKTPGFTNLIAAYTDYQPIKNRGLISASGDPRTDGTQKLYMSQQWGKNAILINTDTRSYRDIRLRTAGNADDTGSRADNAGRTYFGATQLAWIEQSLLDAQNSGTPWKFVAISDPIDQIGPIGGALSTVTAAAMQPYSGNVAYGPVNADGGKALMGGYRAERNALLKFIVDNQIRNVVFLTTDDHQNRINEVLYSTNGQTSVQSSYVKVPYCFEVVDGPFGATGPDLFLNHDWASVKGAADLVANAQIAAGVDPIGLATNYPGLHDVMREQNGVLVSETTPQPADFYSPDTFNYNVINVSTNGKTLTLKSVGINSYAQNNRVEAGTGNQSANSPRTIFSFQVDAADPINKIDHFIVVYQENWSFDALYGSFPGANGIANASATSLNQIDRVTLGPISSLANYDPAANTIPTQNPPVPLNGTQDKRFLTDTNDVNSATLVNTLLPFDISSYLQPGDLTGDIVHKYWQEQFQVNRGSNNMFVTWSDNPGLVMSHFDATSLPEGKLAQQYVMCDNFFHSAFGGSFLNHQFLIACAPPVYNSMPTANNGAIALLDGNGVFALNTSGSASGRFIRDGSITPVAGDSLTGLTINGVTGQSVTVGGSGLGSDVVYKDGSHFDKHYVVNTTFTANMCPTFSTFGSVGLLPSLNNTNPAYSDYVQNIGDRLDAASVSWKWYSGGWSNALDSSKSNPLHPGVAGTTVSSLFQWHHQPFAYFAKSAPFADTNTYADGRNPYATAHLQDEAQLYADVANNNLPAVSFVKFLGPDNEHPGYASLAQGQQHVADLVAQVQANPALWAHTAIIITYDEHGGRWDHVAPPARDIWGPGVRVPAIVISPYAKTNTVDHTAYDTTSILTTIEHRFGVTPLNALDANAPTLMNSLTTTVSDPATPPTIAASQIGNQLALSWPGVYLTYVLQSNSTSLLNPAGWVNVTGVSNNSVMVNLDNTQTNVFYRLIKQ
jgi:phospholipase C/phosphodiesterase/alkaline phosphatase D-like protein